jgi:methylenetetrahydrofolate--tRNA-(uracil-5-)-methyltransferase
MIPGLEQGEFERFGMIHRNTYINAPTVLTAAWHMREHPRIFFAGQISGVEGYVESAASGLIAGLNAVAVVQGRPVCVPPRTTAIGALGHYVANAEPINYQPTNIAFGLIPALDQPPRNKRERRQAISKRALRDLAEWSHNVMVKSDEKASPVFS